MTPPALTRRERELMDVLYALGKGSVKDVMNAMKTPPSYSTVRTLLRLLEERGHLRHAKDGTRYVYTPTVPRSTARRKALGHVVKTFFDGSAEQAMLTLLQSCEMQLDTAEVERLRELIEQAKKRGQ